MAERGGSNKFMGDSIKAAMSIVEGPNEDAGHESLVVIEPTVIDITKGNERQLILQDQRTMILDLNTECSKKAGDAALITQEPMARYQ